ncbi:MAG: NAD(P)H-binding protein [Sulfuricurvum sp.]|nr:NAD(P)H-binding protein [Sulfuricurvum sp.]
MNITIIGASAGVGLECVKRALMRGHSVTTLSRSDITLPSNPNLNMIQGSALDKESLTYVIKNADAVIVALGTGKSMKATTMYSDFAHLLVEIQNEIDTKIPFIVLTGFGAGESWNYNSFGMKLFFRLFLKNIYDNKTKMEQILSTSTLQWECVRPGLLLNKPLSEHYRVENQLFKNIKIGGISRADVADFMIKQAEKPTYLFQYPALSNL